MPTATNRARINITLSGVACDALIDTGACCSLLRRDIYDKVVLALKKPRLLQKASDLCTITGSSLTVLGVTQVKIDQAAPVTFYIVDNILHQSVIGIDALRKGKGVVDLPQRQLKWFGQYWPLEIEPEESAAASVIVQLPRTDNEDIARLIKDYADVFCETENLTTRYNEVLPPMRIHTTGPPIKQRPYRLPLAKRKYVQEQVQEMLQAGIIEHSASAWSSPITLQPKKDGSLRFCVDYRKLNKVTVKDSYPLPLIQDIFDQLTGSTVFSTLDLKSGYWQIPIHEEDRDKVAFSIPGGGLYNFTTLPFGLCNSCGVFMRIMNYVFGPLIGKCVHVYVDDILVYSKSIPEHIEHLRQVFDRLRWAGLKLAPKKCCFAQAEVKLLGYYVGKDGIRTDPDKVAAIVNLPTPKTVRDIRSFLGMAGYYRRCIPDYARVVEPLVKLTRKGEPFEFGEEQKASFEALKQLLTSSEVMAYPDTSKPYKLYTDACDYAIGAILVQDDQDGVEKVIEYVSHQLSGPQLRWATIEKEAYAVIYALNKLKAYLWGAEFTIYTDHKPLTSLFVSEMKNSKIQRWAVQIADFNTQIKYRKGKNNIRADMLSRIRPAQSEVCTFDADEEWISPEAFPDKQADERLPILQDGLDLEEIKEQQRLEYQHLIADANSNTDSEYELLEGLLYSVKQPTPTSAIYPRLILPSGYQEEVIQRAHKEVGHMASHKTLDRVREAYVWPGMRKTVTDVVQRCPICRVHVNRQEQTPMGEMPLATYPCQIIGMDLIGPFIESANGNKYVLTIVDHCTGWAEAYPIERKTNLCVWTMFSNHFLPAHGIPEVVITDQGQEFNALEFRNYLRDLGIDHRRTTPRHPQTNGRTERFNRTLKEMLARLVNNNSLEWEDRLADALVAYRNSVSSVTGHTPFFLMYGRRARLPLTKALSHSGNAHPLGNRLDELSQCLQQARVLTEQSRKYNRERLAQKANAGRINVGDTVVVQAAEPLTFTSKWDPQYEVTRVRGHVVWIRHQQSGKTRVLHRTKLKVVDPNLIWDEVRPRPRRVFKRAAVPINEAEPEPTGIAAGDSEPDRGPPQLARKRRLSQSSPAPPNTSQGRKKHRARQRASSDPPLPSHNLNKRKRQHDSTPQGAPLKRQNFNSEPRKRKTQATGENRPVKRVHFEDITRKRKVTFSDTEDYKRPCTHPYNLRKRPSTDDLYSTNKRLRPSAGWKRNSPQDFDNREYKRHRVAALCCPSRAQD